MHCVKKLQSHSAAFHSRHGSLGPQTPASLVTTPALPPPAAETVPTTEAIGEHLRAGESAIQDKRGRKRRKLDLTSQDPKQQPELANPIVKLDETSYLPESALPIDELFYSKTKMGDEIGELGLEGDIVFEDRDPELELTNFQFTSQHKRPGQAEFVYSRVQYFMSSASQLDIRRHGRDAVAVMPYPKRLQTKACSAIVIQAAGEEKDDYQAVREQTSLLESGFDYSGAGTEQGSTGEYDYLLEKHKQRQSDDGLSMDALIEKAEEEEDSTSAGESDSDDDVAPQAEESDGEDLLSTTRAAEVVDDMIQRTIAKWQQDDLPRLEKKAWTVWRKTKKSKTRRDEMVANATAEIEHLTHRLDICRADILEGEHESVHAVEHACGNLQPSIIDRECHRWRIEVWQRKKEPEHVVHHRAKQATSDATKNPPTDNGIAAFVPTAEDRMSVSPTPAMHVHAEARDHADENLATEVEGEEFHTPEDNPAVTPGSDMDGFLASDEMSPKQNEGSDHEQDESDELYQPSVVSSPSQSSSIVRVPSTQRVSDGELGGNELRTAHEGPEKCPICNVELTGDEQTRNDHFKMCEVKRIMDAESDDDLHSPSTFVRSSARVSPTLTRFRQSGMSTQPIELSSDTSPAPKRKKQGKAKASMKREVVFSANVLDATGPEIDSWDFDYLKDRNDRHRIMLKLLREASPARRAGIHSTLLAIDSVPTRVSSLRAAARALAEDETDIPGLDSEASMAMQDCASLALAWLLLEPQHFSHTPDVPSCLPWQRVYDAPDTDLKLFVAQLQATLQVKDGGLFARPKNQVSDDPISISDSDEPSNPATRKSKRKKVVESQRAKQLRSAALARQEVYSQKESQLTDSAKLAAMIASDPSHSDIPINELTKEDHEDLVYVFPTIAKRMKQHQIDGVRFLWRELTNRGAGEGQGCLLAHTMGLGKTMQTLAVLVAISEVSQSNNPRIYNQLPGHLRPKEVPTKRNLRILIMCPPALITNWHREIKLWTSDVLGNIFTVESSGKIAQMQQIEDWYRFGGVLLIGYNLFRNFIADKETKNKVVTDVKHSTLLRKGPDIVVADEAHTLKNPFAETTRAANAVHTEARIALTGTPMSNDVQEIYELVSWVAPGYFGDPTEFRANFAAPIRDGTFRESTHHQRRKSTMKLKVLHNQIRPKVNRADITVLKGSLKPKVEFVITVPLTELQDTIYKRYVTAVRGGNGADEGGSNVRIFSWLSILGLLTAHPSAFLHKLLTPPNRDKKSGKMALGPESDEGLSEEGAAVDVDEENVYSLGFTEATVRAILEGVTEDLDTAFSAKASILLQVVKLSLRCDDKVLIFSSSIPTLDYILDLLDHNGIRAGRIDGTVAMHKRTSLLESFHNNRFHVMLVSTRAGGVGLNIQGANRVIIMDFGWNPSWEEQAIGRAYRLGQAKPVFVYRFLAGGTFESNMWNKQLFKTSLTQRVVDKKNPRRNAQRDMLEFLHDPRPVAQDDLTQWVGKDAQVLDEMLAQHDPESGKDQMMRTIQTTETLQEEVADEPLNEEETREVEAEIQAERMRATQRKTAGAQGAAAVRNAFVDVFGKTKVTAPRRRVNQMAPPPIANSAPNGVGRPLAPSSTMPPRVPANIVHPMGGLPMPSSSMGPAYQYGLPRNGDDSSNQRHR